MSPGPRGNIGCPLVPYPVSTRMKRERLHFFLSIKILLEVFCAFRLRHGEEEEDPSFPGAEIIGPHTADLS